MKLVDAIKALGRGRTEPPPPPLNIARNNNKKKVKFQELFQVNLYLQSEEETQGKREWSTNFRNIIRPVKTHLETRDALDAIWGLMTDHDSEPSIELAQRLFEEKYPKAKDWRYYGSKYSWDRFYREQGGKLAVVIDEITNAREIADKARLAATSPVRPKPILQTKVSAKARSDAIMKKWTTKKPKPIPKPVAKKRAADSSATSVPRKRGRSSK